MKTDDPPDLRLLRSFVVAVDQGGFSAAARALAISQPSVSNQMKRLEGWVGRRLFQRDGGGATLSADGEALLVFARSLLALSEQAHGHFHGAPLYGRVRLGLTELFAQTAIPRILGLFASLHPALELVVQTDFDNDELFSGIEEDRLDLVVAMTEAAKARGETIATVPLVWVGQHADLCFRDDPVPLVTSPTQDVAKASLRALVDAKRAWRVRFRSNNLAALDAAVGAGLGVGVAMRGYPTGQAAMLAGDCGLPQLGDVALCMVRAQGQATSVAVLADFLRQVVLDMDGDGSKTPLP